MQLYLIVTPVFQPVVIDGALWVGIGICAAMQISFTSDEAYKYLNPTVLWWLKFNIGWINAGCAALKMFRSTAYAKHVQDVKDAAKP